MNAREMLFFRLLRFAFGTESTCPKMHLNEWRSMFQMAKKQALTGFIGSSLNTINGDVLVETDEKSKGLFTDLIMKWTGDTIQIARRNQKVNKDVAEEFRKLEAMGLQCCLLKGQGNALMYPNPDSRTSGDIDMWVRFPDSPNTDANIRKIIRIVKAYSPHSTAAYHHIDAPDINGTPVEVHYRPQFLFSPLHNLRLQQYFIDNADEQFANKVNIGESGIAVPTAEFNLVFQLSHIYNHLFHEGIGLRQIVDYYYVLKAFHCQYNGRGNNISAQLTPMLKRLGLHQIACAIMWILIKQLGMPQECAVAVPDEHRGRFVLSEILQGGNFGHYDARNARFRNTQFGRNIQRLVRDLRLLRYFPSEALSEPFFRLWHALWRRNHRDGA